MKFACKFGCLYLYSLMLWHLLVRLDKLLHWTMKCHLIQMYTKVKPDRMIKTYLIGSLARPVSQSQEFRRIKFHNYKLLENYLVIAICLAETYLMLLLWHSFLQTLLASSYSMGNYEQARLIIYRVIQVTGCNHHKLLPFFFHEIRTYTDP